MPNGDGESEREREVGANREWRRRAELDLGDIDKRLRAAEQKQWWMLGLGSGLGVVGAWLAQVFGGHHS